MTLKPKTKNPKLKARKGETLIIGIILLTVILILAASLFSRIASFLHFGSNTILKEQALYLAEAGLEKAIWQLNETSGSYTGETNTFLPDQPNDLGQFSVSVNEINPALKTITSTGYVPNATSPRAQVTVKADTQITNQVISFAYATQIGSGGIVMNNQAGIKGNVYELGNVYSNGGICDPQSDCKGSGGQYIEGEAWAVGNIGYPPSVWGRHPNASPAPLPDISQQVQAWKDVADDNITTCSPTCTLTNGGNIGPRKYEGNLTISGNATFTVNGPIWVTGNLEISGGSTKVTLPDSFGSNGTGIVTTGAVSISNGANIQTNNADPKGYIMVVTEATGNAIQVDNSGALVIIYASNGTAILSNNTTVNSLVANKLVMSQGSLLLYSSGLASAQFTTCPTCPGAAWVVKKGTYYYSK